MSSARVAEPWAVSDVSPDQSATSSAAQARRTGAASDCRCCCATGPSGALLRAGSGRGSESGRSCPTGVSTACCQDTSGPAARCCPEPAGMHLAFDMIPLKTQGCCRTMERRPYTEAMLAKSTCCDVGVCLLLLPLLLKGIFHERDAAPAI